MSRKLSRRRFVTSTVISSATLIATPYVRGAYAAGKLSIGFWDHWVPGANKISTNLVNEWAEKEKVEVQIDYITGQGNKILLTIAAEAQAKTGHDIMVMASVLDLIGATPLIEVTRIERGPWSFRRRQSRSFRGKCGWRDRLRLLRLAL